MASTAGGELKICGSFVRRVGDELVECQLIDMRSLSSFSRCRQGKNPDQPVRTSGDEEPYVGEVVVEQAPRSKVHRAVPSKII
jgi:hypothetical protein